MRVDTPETRYRAALRTMAESGAGLPAGLPRAAISEAQPPHYADDTLYVHVHASEIRRDYVTRNYRLVLDYILLHGRAVWVTVIFCLGVIATTLIVNPLCAYALSRYSLPYGYKVLLFVLATMVLGSRAVDERPRREPRGHLGRKQRGVRYVEFRDGSQTLDRLANGNGHRFLGPSASASAAPGRRVAVVAQTMAQDGAIVANQEDLALGPAHINC